MGGIKHFSSGSKRGCNRLTRTEKEYIKITPNPRNFVVLLTKEIGCYLVALVKYPECINHNGHKIILFKNETSESLMRKKSVDPHFVGENNVVARFKPGDEGWEDAILLAKGKK